MSMSIRPVLAAKRAALGDSPCICSSITTMTTSSGTIYHHSKAAPRRETWEGTTAVGPPNARAQTQHWMTRDRGLGGGEEEEEGLAVLLRLYVDGSKAYR